ncbi:MAG TPA: transcriptional regulator, partial [Rhodanobacteraceae bacterium]|nr:transcriptional regulator [Rhodanobacteraceae bacterium]
MSRPIYRFGDCTIDASARELRTLGTLATLSPKVFDCLIYLIEHRDRAIGRDELIAAVWGKAEVTDTLLGQTVLKARRAVGDSGNGQNVIRTIPRFGYRWVADIVVDDGAAAVQEAQPAPAVPASSQASASVADAESARSPATKRSAARPRNIGLAIAAVLVLAIAIGALIRFVPA